MRSRAVEGPAGLEGHIPRRMWECGKFQGDSFLTLSLSGPDVSENDLYESHVCGFCFGALKCQVTLPGSGSVS